jgi:hypothetical protein
MIESVTGTRGMANLALGGDEWRERAPSYKLGRAKNNLPEGNDRKGSFGCLCLSSGRTGFFDQLLLTSPQMLTGKARSKRGMKSRQFRIDSRKAKMTPKGIKERKRQQKDKEGK